MTQFGTQFGIHVAPFGELADASAVADLAARAEAGGFDGFFVWDHIARPHRNAGVGDTTVTLAAMAVATSRMRIGALVTPLTRRRPAKYAREMVALDRLSNGRLVAGVGIGVDSGGELSRLGEITDARVRGDRLDEALDLVCALWAGEPVRREGEHFVATDLTFLPTPVQRPRIPIWVASRSVDGRPTQRAARFEGICPELDLDGFAAMIAFVAGRRGSLDGFDVVTKGAPGVDPSPWIRAGATWWLVALPEAASRRAVEAVIAEGPPR